MYKFIVSEGTCTSEYPIQKCEDQANKMLDQGYELVQVYQSAKPTCVGQSKSILVMVFKQMS